MGKVEKCRFAKHSELELLFTSEILVRVLELFLIGKKDEYYQREVAYAINRPLRPVQADLKRLVEFGLLTRMRRNNRVYYSLDPKCRAIDDLTRLFKKYDTLK